ncbi:MAG: hypothetical protein ACJ74W_21380 [Pyrinomonadaceae bacterium]
MTALRPRGVYQFPSGRELIADETDRGFALYDPQAWDQSGWLLEDRQGLPDYEVGPAGELLANGRASPWRITDLTDTGQTVPPRPTKNKANSCG